MFMNRSGKSEPKRLRWTGFAVLFLLSMNSHAAPPSLAEMLSDACTTCHGTDGKGSGKIPKLKGLDANDISESMHGFQTGEEKATIMHRYAKGYTNEELKLIANYFAGRN